MTFMNEIIFYAIGMKKRESREREDLFFFFFEFSIYRECAACLQQR